MFLQEVFSQRQTFWVFPGWTSPAIVSYVVYALLYLHSHKLNVEKTCPSYTHTDA